MRVRLRIWFLFLVLPLGRGQQDVLVIPSHPNALLLVSTLDGQLHAVDRESGGLLWTALDEQGSWMLSAHGRPTSSAQSSSFGSDDDGDDRHKGTAPAYIVEPVDHGKLYVVDPDAGLKKLPYSIKQLVGISPFKSSDGVVYVGRKSSAIVELDVVSGKIVHTFQGKRASTDAVKARLEQSTHWRKNRIVSLGRVDYELSIFDESDLEHPRWNVTYSEYTTGTWDLDGMGQKAKHEKWFASDMLSPGSDGSLARMDRITGSVRWTQNFQSPAISVFEVIYVEDADRLVVVDRPLQSPALVAEETGLQAQALGLMHVAQTHDGTLVLMHSNQYRLPIPNAEDPAPQDSDTLPTAGANVNHLISSSTICDATCRPGSLLFPGCLLGLHQSTENENDMFALDPVFTQQLGGLDELVRPSTSPVLLIASTPYNDSLLSTERYLVYSLLFITVVVLLFAAYTITRKEAVARRAETMEAQTSMTSPTSQRKMFNNLTVGERILGYGSHGTVVYEGVFEGRPVAVKRLLFDFYDVAHHEVSLLVESDSHPNVIRYFCKEQRGQFLYIALELCIASVYDLVESIRPDSTPPSNEVSVDKNLLQRIHTELSPNEMLYQIMSGVQHLHELKIVHRDLKPQNVLIKQTKASTFQVVISDFGLSKRLADDQNSFYHTTMQSAGTVGWRAPESIQPPTAKATAKSSTDQQGSNGSIPSETQTDTASGSSSSMDTSTAAQTAPTSVMPNRITRAADIFSTGLIFYYVLSNGEHPFGDRYTRELNILQGRSNLSAISMEPYEAHSLIWNMIRHEARQRITGLEVLAHPFFWSAARKLNFFQDVSDRLDVEDKESDLLRRFEGGLAHVVGRGGWQRRVHRGLYENLGRYRSYDGMKLRDLLRAIRNKKNHYQDLPDHLKEVVGPLPDGFYAYFQTRFPKLLMYVYYFVKADASLATESHLQSYFEPMRHT